MKDIRTLSLEQLKEYVVTLGEKPFRAKQVYDWLWSKNLHSIDEMTNLSKELREKISGLAYPIHIVDTARQKIPVGFRLGIFQK